MILKKEYVDLVIKNPYGFGHLYMQFVEEDMYPYIAKAGYEYIFEEEKEEPKVVKNKTK